MAEQTALPQPGEVFAGRYLIEQIIGSARMSVVFGARHSVTGRGFAIRWMLPGNDAGISQVSSTASRAAVDAPDPTAAVSATPGEHQVVGHFRHPNVLEVYDVGEVGGSFYTVMEWLDGESLDARLRRVGALPLSEACRLLVPCMRGMHEAHAAGIIHRDLKPANIFICEPTPTSPETVKVLDFEIAKVAGASIETAVFEALKEPSSASPYYRAPELFSEAPTDQRVDVYAFGAILYEVLSGRPPFAPTRRGQVDAAPGHGVALQHRVDRLPLGALQIIARAMARHVDQRFQTLGELADALENYASRPGTGLVARSTQFAHEQHAATEDSFAGDEMRATYRAEREQLGTFGSKQWYIAGALAILAAIVMVLVHVMDAGVVESFEAVGGVDGAAIELRPEAAEPPFDPSRDIEVSRSAALSAPSRMAPLAPRQAPAAISSGVPAVTPVAPTPTWRFPSRAVLPKAAPAPVAAPAAPAVRPKRFDVPVRRPGASQGAPRSTKPATLPRSAGSERDPLDMNLM